MVCGGHPIMVTVASSLLLLLLLLLLQSVDQHALL
jgi:hypothetical protein